MAGLFDETFSYGQSLSSAEFGSLLKGILPAGIYHIDSSSGYATTGSSNEIRLREVYAIVYNTSETSTQSYGDYASRVYIDSHVITIGNNNLNNAYPLLALRETYTHEQDRGVSIIAVTEKVYSDIEDAQGIATIVTSVSGMSTTEASSHLRRENDVIIGRYALTSNNLYFSSSVAFDTGWTTWALRDLGSTTPLISRGYWVKSALNNTTVFNTVRVDSGSALGSSGLVVTGDSTLNVFGGPDGNRPSLYDYIYIDRDGVPRVETGNTQRYENFFGRNVVALISRSSGTATTIRQNNIVNVADCLRGEVDAASLRVRITNSVSSGSTSSYVDTTNGYLVPAGNITAVSRFSVNTDENYTVQDFIGAIWNEVNTLRGSTIIAGRTGDESASYYGVFSTLGVLTCNLRKELDSHKAMVSEVMFTNPASLLSNITAGVPPQGTSATALSTDSSNVYLKIDYSNKKSKTVSYTLRDLNSPNDPSSDTQYSTTEYYYGDVATRYMLIPSANQSSAGVMSSEDKKRLDTLYGSGLGNKNIADYVAQKIRQNNIDMGVTDSEGNRIQDGTQTLTLEQRIRNIEVALWGSTVQSSVKTVQGLEVGNLTVTNSLKY